MSTFKSNTSYALKNPTAYDDEYGTGYGRAETYGPIDCEGMFIVDCWIVNDVGEVHPGYNESPVPVRFEDLVPESAMPAVNSDRQRSQLMWA